MSTRTRHAVSAVGEDQLASVQSHHFIYSRHWQPRSLSSWRFSPRMLTRFSPFADRIAFLTQRTPSLNSSLVRIISFRGLNSSNRTRDLFPSSSLSRFLVALTLTPSSFKFHLNLFTNLPFDS